MPRYAAFLRGVSPMNCQMPALARALEAAGFTNVVTVLSSGNVVFDAKKASESALQKRCEKAMQESLGKTFMTIVRSIDDLNALIESDPFAKHRLPPKSKRVVSFAREAKKVTLPPEVDNARIWEVRDRAIFTSYLPTPKGPVFMTLLEKTLGKEITTRTWETLQKVAKK